MTKQFVVQVRVSAFKGAHLDSLYGPFTSEDYAYRRAGELRTMFARADVAEVSVTVREMQPLIAHRVVRWTQAALAFLRGDTATLCPYLPTEDEE